MHLTVPVARKWKSCSFFQVHRFPLNLNSITTPYDPRPNSFLAHVAESNNGSARSLCANDAKLMMTASTDE